MGQLPSKKYLKTLKAVPCSSFIEPPSNSRTTDFIFACKLTRQLHRFSSGTKKGEGVLTPTKHPRKSTSRLTSLASLNLAFPSMHHAWSYFPNTSEQFWNHARFDCLEPLHMPIIASQRFAHRCVQKHGSSWNPSTRPHRMGWEVLGTAVMSGSHRYNSLSPVRHSIWCRT